MSIALKIYLLGSLIGLMFGLRVLRDKNNLVGIPELLSSIFVGVFSWVGVLALWVGQNIKHGHN